MSEFLIGRFNDVVRDLIVTAEEVGELEKIVYATHANDGYRDQSEWRWLENILDPAKYQLDPIEIQGKDSRKKIQLMRDSGITLNRYLAALKDDEEDLTPTTDAAELRRLATVGITDNLATVTNVQFRDSNHFTVTLTKNGRNLSFSYRGESYEALVVKIKRASPEKYIFLTEVFLAVENYRERDISSKQGKNLLNIQEKLVQLYLDASSADRYSPEAAQALNAASQSELFMQLQAHLRKSTEDQQQNTELKEAYPDLVLGKK